MRGQKKTKKKKRVVIETASRGQGGGRPENCAPGLHEGEIPGDYRGAKRTGVVHGKTSRGRGEKSQKMGPAGLKNELLLENGKPLGFTGPRERKAKTVETCGHGSAWLTDIKGGG